MDIVLSEKDFKELCIDYQLVLEREMSSHDLYVSERGYFSVLGDALEDLDVVYDFEIGVVNGNGEKKIIDVEVGVTIYDDGEDDDLDAESLEVEAEEAIKSGFIREATGK